MASYVLVQVNSLGSPVQSRRLSFRVGMHLSRRGSLAHGLEI